MDMRLGIRIRRALPLVFDRKITMHSIKILRRQYSNWNKFQEWNNKPGGTLFESLVGEHAEIHAIGGVILGDDGPYRIFTFESEEWANWFLLSV